MKKILFCLFFFFSSFISAKEPCWKLFSGSANPELALAVADLLGTTLSQAKVSRFNDGELDIQFKESVRGCDVFLIQSTCRTETSSVDENLMELYLMIRACKRASAKSVTAIVPYFGYARQDRKSQSRVPISASDVALLLETAGLDHLFAVDLHCGQIQGFFHRTPVGNLFTSPLFASYIAKKELVNPTIVSPDAGGVKRAKKYMEKLEVLGLRPTLSIIIKQRISAGEIERMDLIGDVYGRDAIIVDDLCDTAGTLVLAAKELKEHGALRVFACVTHPVFSGSALDRIGSSCIDELIVTDTIPLSKEVPQNIKQLSVAPLIAEAIRRLRDGESLSPMYLFN